MEYLVKICFIAPYIIFCVIMIMTILLGIVFYTRAKNSRRFYRCKVCGECYHTELMKSSCCKVCGGDVVEVNAFDEQ